jgi:hypothetical protein
MRVFVTGASGLIGRALCNELLARGDQVVALSRRRRESADAALCWVQGDPSRCGDWTGELEGTDAVVHLAGESITGGRWTRARKRRLVDSRIQSTQRLVEAVVACQRPPATLVCGSASGYYGPRGDELLLESSPPGHDFLAELCVSWEAAAKAAVSHGLRVVSMRFGAVLDRSGGALARMLLPFRLGLGGPLGPAGRWFPWLHHRDATDMLCFALDHPVSGALNCVATESTTMGDFAKTLGRVCRRPALLPLPLPVLRLALGEMGEALVAGQRIAPRALVDAGYCFRYPAALAALEECVASRSR